MRLCHGYFYIISSFVHKVGRLILVYVPTLYISFSHHNYNFLKISFEFTCCFLVSRLLATSLLLWMVCWEKVWTRLEAQEAAIELVQVAEAIQNRTEAEYTFRKSCTPFMPSHWQHQFHKLFCHVHNRSLMLFGSPPGYVL